MLFNTLKLGIILSVSISIISCSSSPKSEKKEKLSSILEMPHRSEKNKARDQFRHPVETLTFFEVEPSMTVVEISPGGGWYTEILAPYLKDDGQLYLAVFSESTKKDYYKRMNKNLKEKIRLAPEVYGEVTYTIFEVPDKIGPVAPDGTADRVLTFRNVHNWMKEGKLQEAFKAFHKALKPGGILGIVEHRAKTDSPQDPKAASGYVRQDYVIKQAELAGFELVDTSEINANPKDTADHPKGVWTLPPSLRLKDKDQAKYREIGESDRMTLKFVKK